MYVMWIRRALSVILLAGCSTLAWPQSAESQQESSIELSGLSPEELRARGQNRFCLRGFRARTKSNGGAVFGDNRHSRRD